MYWFESFCRKQLLSTVRTWRRRIVYFNHRSNTSHCRTSDRSHHVLLDVHIHATSDDVAYLTWAISLHNDRICLFNVCCQFLVTTNTWRRRLDLLIGRRLRLRPFWRLFRRRLLGDWLWLADRLEFSITEDNFVDDVYITIYWRRGSAWTLQRR